MAVIDNSDVAILIPSKDSGPFFKKCLQSIAAQTYRSFIVIIVDRSSDGSFEIATRFAATDDRFIISKQTGVGVANARNQCLSIAKRFSPKFLTFIDADDYVKPDYIEKLINCLKNNQSDIVVSSFFEQRGDNIWLNTVSHNILKRRLSSFAATKILLEDKLIMSHLHGKMYRAHLWDGVVLDETINYCEDRGVLYIPFSLSKTIFVTDYVGYYYREDNDNALCREPWHRKKILSTYNAYKKPLSYPFPNFDSDEKEDLYVAALSGLLRLHFSLYPRFNYKGASKEEKEALNSVINIIKKNRILSTFVPNGRSELVKIVIYRISKRLYRFLFRLFMLWRDRAALHNKN